VETFDKLRERLVSRTATIGIVGLGYVGLPLAVAFARAGFRVIGMDTDAQRVSDVMRGASYILDVPATALQPLLQAQQLQATTDSQRLQPCDCVVICVPTPLRKTREPDTSFIAAAAHHVAETLRAGQLIILESTTYPGTTEEMLRPLIEAKGFVVGRDVFLAFSPERIDPGNQQFTTHNIPKVVGGVTAQCTELARLLYTQIVTQVVPVSSPKTAEMVKLLENTFRSINIALANEMALLCHALGVNVWEVIEAAQTKPFGFMAFYPGPGLGGHCIPSDPIYLSWKARMHGYEARLIELAAQINSYMPHHVVERVTQLLNAQGKTVRGAQILLLGVAYKRDVTDTRDSPALELIRLLKEREGVIQYHDPYVPVLQLDPERMLSSVALTRETLRAADCVILVTDHSTLDYALITREASLVLDTRNRLASLPKGRAAIRPL